MVFFVLLLIALSLFLFGLWLTTRSRGVITYEDAIQRYHYYYSAANTKKIAFTFDDGPNSPTTETLIEELSKTNTPATFFFIGRRALIRPDIVKKTADAGFDVEDHSFTHGQNSHSEYTRMAFELNTTSYILSQISGERISYYRPPFLLGIGVDPTINPYIPTTKDMAWALQLGYLPVGSDIDSKDWLASSPTQVLENVKKALTSSPNGHIVLFHDDQNTAQAIGDVVAYLRAEGYQIVPLSELLTPPAGNALALTHTLRFGDTNAKTDGEVSKLQWFLYENKFLDPYALTGIFDEQTRQALIAFQTQNALVNPADPGREALGVATPATRSLIHSLALKKVAETSTQVAAAHMSLVNLQPFKEAVLEGYIAVFPVVRAVLVVGVVTTLALVLLRTVVLLGLLLYRRISKKHIGPAARVDGPGVSILIPAYNEQENIAATVESVIRTTYRTREVIVINDGSKDDTAKEVEAVIAANPEHDIRLISVENGGKARALNIGTAAAKHDIIVVLDADAVLDTDAVSYFVPHFDDERVGAVAGRVRTTNASNMLDMFQTLEYAIGQNIDKTAFATVNAIGVVPGPAGAWRKASILAAGGFHTDTLVEDQEMTLSILHMGLRVNYEARAIAYTETPHSVKNFLKQRFRWVYGTMQCFWKHKKVMAEHPTSSTSVVVMPNIFIYNILLPLTYPFADSALLFGLIFGEWRSLVLPFIIFTIIDLIYAVWGLRDEPNKWKLLAVVPFQRVVYRQLLYYTVYKALVRAIEGSGTGWNKFAKTGETRRFYLAAMGGVGAAVGNEVAKSVVPASIAVEEEKPEEQKSVVVSPEQLTPSVAAVPVMVLASVAPQAALAEEVVEAPLAPVLAIETEVTEEVPVMEIAPGSIPVMPTTQLPQFMSETVTMSFQGPSSTSELSTNLQEVMSLSSMPRHFHSAGDTSSPARSPNVLLGVVDDPNTYAKSSSPFGPTSSH